MRARTKLAAYGLFLVAVLGVGAAAGTAAGPIEVSGTADHGSEHEDAGTTKDAVAELPAAGLLVSQDGYHMQPQDRLADAGEFGFTIVGPDRHPVQSYDEVHDRELHLIVASRDLRQFAHLHPDRDAEGRWSVQLPQFPAGAYRAFADFQPAGAKQYTLGVDLVVPGAASAIEPLRAKEADTVDGYEVSLDRDSGSEVTVTVRMEGEVVTTDPYLGSAGHLVALRDGDLAYLHVHPLDEEPSGPVRFAVEVPSAGTYALFFDFQVDGVVRTARFVLDVAAPPTAAAHGDATDH